MKKAAYIALTTVILLSLVYMLGPAAPKPHLNPMPDTCSIPIDSLDGWIAERESGFKTLKPGNGAEIVWFNDSASVTDVSIVYLHGFSACKVEGNPVHRAFASRYGCNLYLPRLYGHGLDTTEPLMDLTPENYLQSAKEAVAIGKSIGKQVILMCSSTGGTLGLCLAAHDPRIKAVICYSPNIDIYDPRSQMLGRPWGLELARIVSGGNYREYEASDEFKRFWQTRYRLESAVAVRMLIDCTMTPATFNRVTVPVFVGAYYKNEDQQDHVVSVKAMRAMMPMLGTPDDQKKFVTFPNVGAHVMTNPLRSDDVKSVLNESFIFAEQTIGMRAVAPKTRNATQ